MKQVLKIVQGDSYKIGVDEVIGLRSAMESVMEPIRDLIRHKAYWNNQLEFNELEYKSRPGFIPNSHNYGGVELDLIVPECESSEWSCLEFGEAEINPDTNELYDNDGELDAYLRIILKFEGIDSEGNMKFYLNVCGGNNDAPYFRISSLPELFEAEFMCKSIEGMNRKASKYIKNIIKLLK